MTFPAYHEYKDSGVEWLGEVPSHWKVRRLRFLAEMNPSKTEVADLSRSTAVSFLPMEAVGDDGRLDLERTRPIEEVESGYTYFREGDVAFAKITPCFENGKGAIMKGLTGGVGFGTTELIVVRPKPDRASSAYLHWLFSSIPFRKLGEAAMYGAGGQKRVPDAFVRDFALGVPPLAEQSAIAAFLDRETGKIDTLVAEQEKLIELLKEKRQAVISHAVTKGLDPNVPMKDSGVEWLGEVPEHWEVLRVKTFCLTLEQGWSPQCENYPADGSGAWGVLKVGCVNGGQFNPTENKALPDDLEPVPALAVSEGDLLISRANTRELVGSAAVASRSYQNLMICDKLYRLRLDPTRCQPTFLSFYLASNAARGQIELGATGASSSMQNIGQATIRELPAPMPPIAEQSRIIRELENHLHRLEMLSAEAQRAIDLLKERRSALISAAVTGKIDVRGLVDTSPAPEALEPA